MNKITICLTNWKRANNLKRIIDTLLTQSVKSTIFLWNNGGNFSSSNISWQINSSKNMFCSPRWYMAVNAETEFICILDDDLFFEDDNVLQDILNKANSYGENTIFG